MNGVNYQKHKPSGDQNLPLEGMEVPILPTSLTCQPGHRHLTHFLKQVPGTPLWAKIVLD